MHSLVASSDGSLGAVQYEMVHVLVICPTMGAGGGVSVAPAVEVYGRAATSGADPVGLDPLASVEGFKTW